MKKNLWLLLTILAAFAGCQNDTPGENGDNATPYVRIERDTLYLGCEGGVENLFVESHSLSWDYTYDDTTGQFATIPGRITVPQGTFTQDPITGAWTVTPGLSTLVVTGTV